MLGEIKYITEINFTCYNVTTKTFKITYMPCICGLHCVFIEQCCAGRLNDILLILPFFGVKS